MALFGKSDGFTALVKKIQGNEYQGPAELEKLLADLTAAPEFDPLKLVWMLSHGNRRLRTYAIETLEPVKSKLGVDTILAQMEGKPSGVRQDVAKLLATETVASLQPRLNRIIRGKTAEEREIALDIITTRADWLEFLGLLKIAMKDEEPRIRHAATRLMVGGAQDPSIAFILREAARDEDAVVRQIVIEALAADPSPDLVDTFFERMPYESAPLRAIMVGALSRLAKRQDTKIEERLQPVLASEDAALREAAARLLSEMPNQARVLRAFLVHARGMASWLRERATNSILAGAKSIGDALVELLDDADDDVRVSAMLMLGQLGDDRVVPHAERLFKSTADWWIRAMGVEVLSRFPTPQVLDILLSLKDDPEVRCAVIAELPKFKLPAAEAALVECLTDPMRGIRLQTLDSLGTFDNERVATRLAGVVRDDPESRCRERARTILTGLKCLTPEALAAIGFARQDVVAPAPDGLELALERDAEKAAT